ncbi:YdcF family protein [Rhodopila sp.]|uniref:YdcF family protein n=1 Tax=Rhodopila sp. TaxID=2480087 RepID=UPI003D0C7F1D
MLLPPTGLVILAVAGLTMRAGWRRFGRRLTWTALIALILLGMPIVSNTMLRALEPNLMTTRPADHPPRAIVVLSADETRTDQEKLGARPGLLTLDRLRTAAMMHRRTGLPILVSGGVPRPGDASVAAVMAQSLQDDFRTPVRWVEPKSADTWQNARFSADILRADGIDSIYLVTHSWHMRRAILAFRQAGLTVTAAPTDLDAPPRLDLGDFIPRVSAWQTGYYALHEWIGYAFYTMR